MPHRLVCLSIVSACFLLSACQGYDVKVNDKVVYAPKPLFSDFTVPDPGLNSCLEQAINDGVITWSNSPPSHGWRPSTLTTTRLSTRCRSANCPHCATWIFPATPNSSVHARAASLR